MEYVDVDKICQSLGPFKRYQIFQILYTSFGCLLSLAYPMLIYVFAAYRPPYSCKPIFVQDFSKYGLSPMYNSSDVIVLTEECKVIIKLNSSANNSTTTLPCVEGYQYDTSQSTIITDWNLVCDRQGLGELTQTLVTVGQAIGASVFPAISDRFGRKPVIVGTHLIATAAAISMAFAPNYIVYSVLRLIFGAFQQGIGLAMAIYVTEMVPKEKRGTVGAIGSMCWSVTVVILAIFGYGLRHYSWRYLHLATGLVGINSLVSYWLIDESLRWLVANKKTEQAKTLVMKIAKINKIDTNSILPLLEKQTIMEDRYDKTVTDGNKRQKKENIFSILRNRTLMTITGIMFFTWLTNSLTYYGLLLTSTQLAGNRFLNFFLNAVVEIPATLTYMLLVNRISRRRLSVLFHGIAGVSLIISVILDAFKDNNNNMITASQLFSFLGKFGISGSFSTLYLFTPELYPTNLRNIGIGMGSTSARIGGMFAPYSSLLAIYIPWGPGAIFGISCIIVACLQFLLPETKKRELAQTATELTTWQQREDNTLID